MCRGEEVKRRRGEEERWRRRSQSANRSPATATEWSEQHKEWTDDSLSESYVETMLTRLTQYERRRRIKAKSKAE